jgi:hypothetical protein
MAEGMRIGAVFHGLVDGLLTKGQTMKHTNGGFLKALQIVLVASGLVFATAPWAQTQNSKERQQARDTKQDSRQGARKEKVDCRQANNKSNAECRQDKRNTKQEGRKDARDIKY